VAGGQATGVTGFGRLLRENRNYRWAWIGQVISEVGDNYNNIAVFALAMSNTRSGLVVAGIFVARALPMMLAGPLAGVLLDRMDRRRIMIASDLVRAALAVLFILGVPSGRTWLLYVLSAGLMFASPFFTVGRSAIMPSIASKDELQTASALTQMTRWSAQTIGSFLGGAWIAGFGYEFAFLLNAASFLASAWCIARIQLPVGVQPSRSAFSSVRPWHDYTAGLRYMRATPLIFGIGLISVGWASGGGAAQILFTLFGETIFQRGPAGIGLLWGMAGLGLVPGAMAANWMAHRISHATFKHTISIAYLLHGSAYVLFALAPTFASACWWMFVSRFAMGISHVLTSGHLMRHVTNDYRGRVFATIESWSWTTMLISMAIAGIASDFVSPRTIGVWSGIASSSTALWWAWANYAGHLPAPTTPTAPRSDWDDAERDIA
jgi:hypothetical protein